MEPKEVILCPGTANTLVRMLVRARAYYAWVNLPFFNHAAIELFWMDKAFIMLQDDLEACENIYSMNIFHKKSLI